MADCLKVVAGILRNQDGCILIAERLGDPAMANQWEFPGGKIAEGESPEVALRRELNEELGIDITRSEYFTTLEHRYPDRHVSLDFFLVLEWTGQAAGCEGQKIDWRLPRDIDEHELLAADGPVLARLQAEEVS